MLVFKPNWFNIISRTISLLVILVVCYFLCILKPGFDFKDWFPYVYIGMIAYFITSLVASLLSYTRVEVDEIANTITVISTRKKLTFLLQEIESYYVTTGYNRFGRYYGLLLNIQGSKTVQLAGQNTSSLPLLQEFLSKRGIPNLGNRKMKYPF